MEEILIRDINATGIVGPDGSMTPWDAISTVGKKEIRSENIYTAGMLNDVLGHQTVRYYARDDNPDGHLSVANIRPRKIKGVVSEIPVRFSVVAEKLLCEAMRHPHIHFEYVNAAGEVGPLNVPREIKKLRFQRSPEVKSRVLHQQRRVLAKVLMTLAMCGILIGFFFWLTARLFP